MPRMKSTRGNKSWRMKRSVLARRVAGAMKSAHLTEKRLTGALIAAAIILAVGAIVGAARPARAIANDAAANGHAPAVLMEARAASAAAPVDSGRPGPAAKAPAAPQAPVTVTGCLERDADTFRLKNTTGADLPKARSWKSGFLKKGSATIQVVDAPNSVKLPDHVGQRVTVTGMLVDRSMKVRSLRRVAESCNQAA
jgi:hypothetical protein